MKRKAKPIKAWAIMDGDKLAKLYVSGHQWSIYDKRDVARVNLRGYGPTSFRIASVEIKEIK